MKKNNFEIDVFVEADEWLKEMPDIVEMCRKTAEETLVEAGAAKEIKNIEIAITLAFDEFIQDLNKRFRKQDKPTNVLSFPNSDITPKTFKNFSEGVMLGDIVISLDVLKREAAEQQKKLSDHAKHMIIHGTLHLLGFDHEEEKDAKKMETLEIQLLKRYNIPNPYIIDHK